MLTVTSYPNDDAAILKDPKAVTPRTVKQAQPYPGVQPVQPRDARERPPEHPPRRQTQRRREERRKANLPVLLDTRSGRDRRNAAADAGVQVEGAGAPTATGIDVYS